MIQYDMAIEPTCHLLQSELLEPWREPVSENKDSLKATHGDDHACKQDGHIERGGHCGGCGERGAASTGRTEGRCDVTGERRGTCCGSEMGDDRRCESVTRREAMARSDELLQTNSFYPHAPHLFLLPSLSHPLCPAGQWFISSSARQKVRPPVQHPHSSLISD